MSRKQKNLVTQMTSEITQRENFTTLLCITGKVSNLVLQGKIRKRYVEFRQIGNQILKLCRKRIAYNVKKEFRQIQ